MTNIFSNCLQIHQRENRMHEANLMRIHDGSQFSLDSFAILATMTHDQTVGLIHVFSHQLKSLMYNLFVLSRFFTTYKEIWIWIVYFWNVQGILCYSIILPLFVCCSKRCANVYYITVYMCVPSRRTDKTLLYFIYYREYK